MQRGQAFKAKRQVFQASRTSIIQGIDDNYSRHRGQALKAWRSSFKGMDGNIIKGMEDNNSKHG